MSIKFNDHETNSPLDLVLQTGRVSPYFNAVTMDRFYAAVASADSNVLREYLLSHPVW